MSGGEAGNHPGILFSEEELRAFQRGTPLFGPKLGGTAAIIMPVRDGWKVSYVSGLDFERESGTLFESFDEAIEAISDLLPKANSEDEPAKYAGMEELLRLRRHITGEAGKRS